MDKDRIPELDLLRGVAILLVVLSHTADYIGDNPVLAYSKHGFIAVGLGAFAFITGYGLEHGWLRKKELSLRRYVQRRLWRVYVPYLIALAVFLLVFGVLSVHRSLPFRILSVNTVIHILGLQGLFSPKYSQIFTLWYIGLLLPMYAVFPLLLARKDQTRYIIRCTLLIMGIAIALRYFFNIIDIRFFAFFPIFIAGLIARRAGLLTPLLKKQWGIVSLIGFVALYVAYMQVWGGAVIYDTWKGDNTAFFILPILTTFLLIAFALVASLCLMRFVVRSPQLQWMVDGLAFIAAGAYFIYLFHRPIFAIHTWLVKDILALPPAYITPLFTLMAVAMVVACGFAEKAYVERVYKPRIGTIARNARLET